MKNTNIGFEMLNAYVDGEMNAADTAAVAAEIAHDSKLARRVAVLTSLRSSIIESVEPPEIDFYQKQDNRKRAVPELLVAGIAFLVFLSGSVLLSSSFDHPLLPMWHEEMVGALESWPDRPGGIPPLVDVTDSAGSLAGGYVPDLSSAMLFINHVVERTDPVVGNLRVIGYRGTRGCRVILAIFADSGSFPVERISIPKGDMHTYAWRAGRLGYAMAAEGMDPERFRLVAESVHKTTLRHLPVDSETRIALGISRQGSVPCTT